MKLLPKILKVGALLLMAGMALQCGASKEITPEQQAAFKAQMEGRHFWIQAQAMHPMMTQSMMAISNSGMLPPGSSAGRIQITGGGYGLWIRGDSISVDLPYFGERQFGGGYDPKGNGITAKGIPEDFQLQSVSGGERYEMQFRMHQNNETLNFRVDLFANQTANFRVISSNRGSIAYEGNIKSLEER